MPSPRDPRDEMIGRAGQITIEPDDVDAGLFVDDDAVIGDDVAVQGLAVETIPQWRLAVRKFRRHKVAMVALFVLTVIVLGAVLAPWVAPYGETEQNLEHSLEAPSADFWFGTDNLGRDNFSRILYGGMVSILVGVAVALIVGTLGTAVGVISGYFGGFTDSALMRFTDTLLALPFLMIVIVLARIMGDGVWDIVLVLSLFTWMTLARIVRGQVLSLKQREFVEAAHALGTPSRRVITRHLLPNLVGVITVNVSLTVAVAILAESTLSFFGLGIDPTQTATWGNMLGGNEGFVTTAPWLVWFPGLAIVFTVLCINFIGDGLRDALDPTQGKH